MNFWNFGAIFVDFSEAEDLFVIIFSDFGPNWKDQGPRVDFKETQGLLCKTPGITN